jgi:hypothetical protein
MVGVRLFVAAAGNEFMLDIADALRATFVGLGTSCTMTPDALPSADTTELQIVVAPHEFFPLSPAKGLDPAALESLLRSVYVLNVEQPGSSWFDLAFDYACRARGVFDISREATAEFRRRGIRAEWAPLGIAPTFAAAQQIPLDDRPIDILFMGHASARREQFIARHGAFFSNPKCHIVLTDVEHPRTDDTPGYYGGDNRRRLVASSRILLNVHSSERTYFETHRAVLALGNGCLLVTETSRHTDPLQQGRHFSMAPLDELAALCQKYLDDPAELERIARAGQSFAAESMAMSATCRHMIDVFRRETAARKTVAPKSGSAWDLGTARAAVIRRLAESRERRRLGQPDVDLIKNIAYDSRATPAVSVVVTLHNYALHIGQCLTSVENAELPDGGLELVVVDDASTDHSVSEARRVLDRANLPALLVAKNLNTGLADARNIGFEHARGDVVFVLDADNWIYPTCLTMLQRAFRADDIAAAYGIVQRFSDETGESLGLLSKYAWNVRDLLRGPYIDAMAMFKRKAVLDAGGYATDLIEHGWFGWEDYALWLTLAQAGLRSTLVPIVVGCYREHPASMIHRTNTSTEAIARYFARKFAPLIGQHPGLDRYFGYPASAVLPSTASVGASEAPKQTSETDQLRAYCSELQREIGDLHASMSWKLTSPLRAVYELLGLPRRD